MRKESSEKGGGVLYAGLDEVGMGCWAGPLLVVVTAFSEDQEPLEGVADSKKLSKKKREKLAPLIVQQAAFVGEGWVSAKFIDEQGLAHAWQTAAANALDGAPYFEHLYVDGRRRVDEFHDMQSIHDKGESKFWQVAAASIVAKVLRDKEMVHLASHYRPFGWEKNAGYGTKAHQDGLMKYRPTPQHRMTYLGKFIEKHRPPWG